MEDWVQVNTIEIKKNQNPHVNLWSESLKQMQRESFKNTVFVENAAIALSLAWEVQTNMGS